MLGAISKAKLSRIRSLRSGKNRKKYLQCVVEGRKMVSELCDKYMQHIEFICVAENFDHSTVFLPLEKTFTIELDLFNQISTQSNPDGILAIVNQDIFSNQREGNLCVFLDGIKDPGNLGTIIRTCDWFGVKTLLMSKDTVDYTNEKVIQASMGSIWRQPMKVIDPINLNADYQGYNIYIADLGGRDLNALELDRHGKNLIVIGNESHGVRVDLHEATSITIPRRHGSEMESLNASISAAILIAWFSLH